MGRFVLPASARDIDRLDGCDGRPPHGLPRLAINQGAPTQPRPARARPHPLDLGCRLSADRGSLIRHNRCALLLHPPLSGASPSVRTAGPHSATPTAHRGRFRCVPRLAPQRLELSDLLAGESPRPVLPPPHPDPQTQAETRFDVLHRHSRVPLPSDEGANPPQALLIAGFLLVVPGGPGPSREALQLPDPCWVQPTARVFQTPDGDPAVHLPRLPHLARAKGRRAHLEAEVAVLAQVNDARGSR